MYQTELFYLLIKGKQNTKLMNKTWSCCTVSEWISEECTFTHPLTNRIDGAVIAYKTEYETTIRLTPSHINQHQYCLFL